MPKLIACSPLAESLPRRVSGAGLGPLPMIRRRAAGLLAAGLWLVLLAGCGNPAKWHSIDVSGSLPPLSFAMTRAADGKEVTEARIPRQDRALVFRLHQLPGSVPDHLVEPGRDPAPPRVRVRSRSGCCSSPSIRTATRPAVLAAYVRNFAPQIEGLRGTPDQLAALARRYRVVYSVTPATKDHPYEVTHSSAIYVFDGSGAARLIIASLDYDHARHRRNHRRFEAPGRRGAAAGLARQAAAPAVS